MLPFWGRYGLLILTAVFCLTNPVMQLSGWAGAETSDRRVYAGDINAGWWESKDAMKNSAFFVPTRGDNWGCSRGATLYQVGVDTFFEETAGRNLDEQIPGYHCSYEIQEETQAQHLIGVVIRRPQRIDKDCRVRLVAEDGQVIAEAVQIGSGRYKLCRFSLDAPVEGVRRIEFVDADGELIWFKDYIAWVSAW